MLHVTAMGHTARISLKEKNVKAAGRPCGRRHAPPGLPSASECAQQGCRGRGQTRPAQTLLLCSLCSGAPLGLPGHCKKCAAGCRDAPYPPSLPPSVLPFTGVRPAAWPEAFRSEFCRFPPLSLIASLACLTPSWKRTQLIHHCLNLLSSPPIKSEERSCFAACCRGTPPPAPQGST